MLIAWTIPNTAASIVGGAVSLNLSHAFEAGMAGYGLSRILTSQKTAGLMRPAFYPEGSASAEGQSEANGTHPLS